MGIKNSYGDEVTLTSEQEKCLNYHLENRIPLIKGYAGSGKSFALASMALVHMKMYPEGQRKHKVALFTYTNSLTRATREFLDANPQFYGEDICTYTVDKYLYDVYTAIGGPYRKMYYGKIRQDNIQQALNLHEKAYGTHRFHRLPIKFWEEEIDWMKSMNVSAYNKRYYLELPRKGRGSDVRMSAEDRVTAYQIYLTYRLVCDKKNCGDWSDFALYINEKIYEYARARYKGENVAYPVPVELMFDYIFIDEAQDLSLAQMLALMGTFSKGMAIAMDAHQRIYAANWTPKQLGIDTQIHWLKKSMRNTVEIDAFAEALRKKNDEYLGVEDREARAVPERHGPKPIVCRLKNQAEEKTYVIRQIQAWMGQSGNKARIAVIGATKSQVDKYSTWCSDAGIYHEIVNKECSFSMRTPGVKILNAYNAKGLEFFYVIIPEFVEGNFPFRIREKDPEKYLDLMVKFRSLAYVAFTRAQQELIITFSGQKASSFIDEIDSSLYDFKKSEGAGQTARTQTREITKYGSGTAMSSGEMLIDFFTGKGFECIDKRERNCGSLWVIGSRAELAPVINEAKRIFGNLGNNNFAPNGGKATGHRPAWFMTANK